MTGKLDGTYRQQHLFDASGPFEDKIPAYRLAFERFVRSRMFQFILTADAEQKPFDHIRST